MDTFFAGLPLTDVHQALARNIKSIRVSQNQFDDLSDDPVDWHTTENHEIATKPHSYVSQAPSIDLPFEEAGRFNAIEYPFKNLAIQKASTLHSSDQYSQQPSSFSLCVSLI